MSSKSLGVFYGVLGVVMFSSKAVMVKLAYRYDVDTLDLLLFRMLFSLPFYIFILFLIRKKSANTKIVGKDYAWLLLFGFVGYYLASYFDFLGLNYIKAGLERIILFVYPTIVVFLSWLIFRQKISKVQFIAILVTYVGVLITFWDELEVSGNEVLLGGFLVLLSAITYASYLVGSGWLIPKFGVLRFTCYAMIVSTICIVMHYLVSGHWGFMDYPWPVYAYGFAMAIFATFIPSFLVSAAIERLGASNFSILGSLGPISTILLAYVFLDEKLTYWQLVGMSVVIFGVTYLSIQGKKRAKG
ncbi:MAG: DMT family transporter [Bacteroidota bacterium]|uniref:EamA family transporter n=1 Tax=Flagellimonas profundi TaxID=2915620 RepID=A0ABS3FCK1_9FLAO|nr:DMT family transporter [Allomuricauda profundi]MBO0340880.1 EamA family transporter [Allomuricauda profundi]MEC7771952.1 DMT family transporter [Bacteroidota bacterium]